jgi:hypothetical protein
VGERFLQAGARPGHDLAQHRGGALTVPFGRAEQAADVAAGAVDHHRGRQAEGAERPVGGGLRVAIDAQMLDPGLGIELLDLGPVGAVDRKRQDDQVVAAKPGLETVEGGHLAPTGGTPSGPEVQDHHPPAEILEAERGPGSVLERERRHRLRFARTEVEPGGR